MSRSITVTIQPDNNPTGTQYQIERSKDQTFFTGTQVVRSWSTQRSYIDSVPEGFKFFYRAKAKDADGDESNWSNVVTVVSPLADGVLRVTAHTTTTLTIAWDAVPEAKEYTLKRDAIQVYKGPLLTFQDTGLSPGTDYTYTLISSNDFGPSAPVDFVGKTDLEPPKIEGSLNP
ncbi:hypothetical protein ACK8P5_26720 (plasmid) [Paenibacillus sp. EC2-1]|uniref:hypothetical protein n=1 Tax=Paenibacillus sp. EC2-1 TaxID=3388665 RepID=UPI003BEEB4ED